VAGTAPPLVAGAGVSDTAAPGRSGSRPGTRTGWSFANDHDGPLTASPLAGAQQVIRAASLPDAEIALGAKAGERRAREGASRAPGPRFGLSQSAEPPFCNVQEQVDLTLPTRQNGGSARDLHLWAQLRSVRPGVVGSCETGRRISWSDRGRAIVAVPDLAPVIELTRRYQPASGPMTAPIGHDSRSRSLPS
jgi:hypothetical protein